MRSLVHSLSQLRSVPVLGNS